MLTKEERYARHRAYQKTPGAIAKRIAYDEAYQQTPRYKEALRKRMQSVEFKQKQKIASKKYRSTLEYKAWKKAYRNSPEAKDARRNQLLQKNFGITLEKYREMLSLQNGLCAICFGTEELRMLAVDHCHKTGKIRGLLCRYCNQALGIMKDDVERMLRAVEYLKKANLS